MKANTIECPHCHELVNVDEVLTHTAEERIRKEMTSQFSEKERLLEKQHLAIKESEVAIKKQKLDLQSQVEEKVSAQLRNEKKLLEVKLKKQAAEETADQLDAMKKELEEKSSKLKDLNKATAEIERLKREKTEMQSEIEAKMEKQHSAKLSEEQNKIRAQVKEESELQFKELQMKLDAQKKLTEEMKRKQEQGSMQMQGEVQELAIEEFLAQSFPLDSIGEIKKGAMGGDCIQTVNTRINQNCGTIYYESKRTKNFSNAWIEKFKQDMREKGADIGVLVTETMPADMERMGMKDGIYICTFAEFKGLSQVLRQSVIRISDVLATQENKGDKMEMLYHFLTSNEFRMQIEAIVEGFRQMHDDLESEKNAMRRLWKKREKQIEKVQINTIDMHGAIKGIAGNAIQNVKALELDQEFLTED